MTSRVYTPFFRRFADERTLEAQATEELYTRVVARHKQFAYSDEVGAARYAYELFKRLKGALPFDVLLGLCHTAKAHRALAAGLLWRRTSPTGRP